MGTFVKIIIFVFVLYIGVLFAIPWSKYYAFRNAFKNTVESSSETNIPANIAKSAEDVGVPVKKEDVRIEEFVNKKRYYVTYSATVTLPFGKEVKFDYMIEQYKLSGE
jgi:hypothetical protein